MQEASLSNCLQLIDERFIKPMLIYKYDIQKAKKKDEFVDMFERDADKWEDMYVSLI